MKLTSCVKSQMSLGSCCCPFLHYYYIAFLSPVAVHTEQHVLFINAILHIREIICVKTTITKGLCNSVRVKI